MTSTTTPSATPAPGPLSGSAVGDADAELEGEQGEQSQVGIMYSERTWEVPLWVKAATFWVGVLSLGGLGVFEVGKRAEFRGLLIDSVVEPEDWGNAPAPEIALNALYKDGKDGGGAVKLSDLKGRWVLVNFWATWCAPCREEIPVFVRMQERHGPKGLQFVGIAIDRPEQVAAFAREFGINYPVLLGGLDTMELMRQTGNRPGVLPFTLVLDRSGRITSQTLGEIKEVKLENVIQPLL